MSSSNYASTSAMMLLSLLVDATKSGLPSPPNTKDFLELPSRLLLLLSFFVHRVATPLRRFKFSCDLQSSLISSSLTTHLSRRETEKQKIPSLSRNIWIRSIKISAAEIETTSASKLSHWATFFNVSSIYVRSSSMMKRGRCVSAAFD